MCDSVCGISVGLRDRHTCERGQKSRETSKAKKMNVPQWGTLPVPHVRRYIIARVVKD